MLENEKGASAVEFAFILPLFLTLVFGVIEFGTILFDKAVIINASREGARFGVMFDPSIHTDAEIRTRVNEFLSGGIGISLINLGGNSPLPLPDEDIPIDPPADVRSSNDLITVSVIYRYDYLFLDFVPGIPEFLSLKGTTTMRME